jgi:hypothetical protein
VRYNKNRVDHTYKVGDRVLRVNNVLSDASLGFSSGLAPAYEGPFVISRRIGNNVFDLVTLDDEPAGRRYVDVLKPYREQPRWARDKQVLQGADNNLNESDQVTDVDHSSSDDSAQELRPKR